MATSSPLQGDNRWHRPPGPATAEIAGAAGNPVPHRTVVVHSGDTLWSIAAKAAPSADPRVTVEKIRLLNHLDGGGVQVGQALQLP